MIIVYSLWSYCCEWILEQRILGEKITEACQWYCTITMLTYGPRSVTKILAREVTYLAGVMRDINKIT